MEKVSVLIVSYGSRAACIADALMSSDKYEVKIYDADKQRNPFILNRAVAQELTGLDVGKICEFAKKYCDELDFGIVGPENPIIDGVRDLVEEETGVPMISPTKNYAIEGSKAAQRRLLDKCCPEANPMFKVFDPCDYSSVDEVRKDLWEWLEELENQVVVKPDLPATGKGVGVWGDHFSTREQLFEHFLSIYRKCKVIVEERIEGEEFSLQVLSDGKRLIPTPAVRDYKRAYDNDLGPNTGGMGAYKDKGDILPFMKARDWVQAVKIAEKIFNKYNEGRKNSGLRGVPLYLAFTCTADGLKVFEINSRPGDPEIQNLLPILNKDFVDLCFELIEGRLSAVNFDTKATVVTYAVPLTYGGYRDNFSGSTRVDLSQAYRLKKEKYGENLRIYPGAMELREEGKTYALSSRTVCFVGIGNDIEEARNISLDGTKAVDGALWNRWDIGSSIHIARSKKRMKKLRSD